MPSTVVSNMKYDPIHALLRITFVSGMVYEYKDVPEQVFNSLKTSGSKGTFLNRHIKGHYPYEKIR
jgi:hypothetical protein